MSASAQSPGRRRRAGSRRSSSAAPEPQEEQDAQAEQVEGGTSSSDSGSGSASESETSSDEGSNDAGETDEESSSSPSSDDGDADTAGVSADAVEHLRRQLVHIVSKKDASKLSHVDRLVGAFAKGAVPFAKLQAKVEQQFGERLEPFLQGGEPDEAPSDDHSETAVPAVPTVNDSVSAANANAGLDAEQIEQIREQLTAIVLAKKPKKKKLIPKLVAALAAKDISFAELQSNVQQTFQADLVDPRLSKGATVAPAIPQQEANSSNSQLDIEKFLILLRTLLQEHDPSKVKKVKKFAAALKAGKLTALQIADEFSKQYGVSVDVASCLTPSSASTNASESEPPTVDMEWVESQLTQLIADHDPKNVKRVGKILGRLQSGKMSFATVQQLVLEQYGSQIFAVRPDITSVPAATSMSESSATVSGDGSAVVSNATSEKDTAKAAPHVAVDKAKQRPERRIADEQIDINIRSEKFEEYFRLNLALFAKITKLIPRYQRAIEAFLQNQMHLVVDTRAMHAREVEDLLVADRSSPVHVDIIRSYGAACGSNELFGNDDLSVMHRDLRESLVEFKPYHESTVSNLAKRVNKRRTAMRKFEQCATTYERALAKAKGQTQGNSFVGAEDNPIVIERLEEQNQAKYLLQTEHDKLLEQISVLKNRHEALISLHLATYLQHEVATSSKVFNVVSNLVMKPLQEREIQELYNDFGIENRSEFGDLIVDPGKMFFDAELKFWREYLRTVQGFQRTLPGLVKNQTARAEHVIAFFSEIHDFVDPIQLHSATAHALADTQKSYLAIHRSGFVEKFESDVVKGVERLRGSSADLITHLTQFVPRRRGLCGKLQRAIKKHEQEVGRAKKKLGTEFANAPQVQKAQAEVDAAQAELQSEVATMTAMLRTMHCHREMHLSAHLQSFLELEMQVCGSLFTGLDYILKKM